MNTPNPKFDIERENQTLKVFFFTVQGGQMSVEFPEDFKAVMAYNDKGAIDMIRKDYPAGVIITVRKRGEVSIAKIIDAINLRPSAPQNLKIAATPPPTRETTLQDFVFGMMFIADKFVTNKRDRATLKKIVKKIKLHDENKVFPSRNKEH